MQPLDCFGPGHSPVQDFLLSTLKDATQVRYLEALKGLSNDLREAGVVWADLSEEEQDWWLAEWLLDAFEAGGSKVLHGAALSALSRVNPRCRFKVVWKVYDVWSLRQPVHQAPAATPELLTAIFALIILLGRPHIGMAMFLCYVGLLRVREALNLKHADIIDNGSVVVLCLGSTKRGLEQKVVMNNSATIIWLRGYLNRFSSKKNDLAFPISYTSVLKWLRKATDLLGVGHLNLSTHTFRRSGASELSRLGYPMADILLYGRWLSDKAAREYIRKGEVAVLRGRGQISHRSAISIDQWCSLAPKLWDVYSRLYNNSYIAAPVFAKVTQEAFDKFARSLFGSGKFTG